ncbi:hypothetical protein F2Q68_00025480 [Brassica cretica]|uniref:Uncharacterized protein n=1 Tax=Brassica cretica TaxID=69181 RepID=A0A8S9IF33_BRACR|nr:hypothetical protein F2Q68_00025480 [Brassica cretica]
MYVSLSNCWGLEKEEGHLKTTHHNNIVQLLYSFQEKSLLASEVPIGYQAGTFTLEDLTYSLGMARSRDSPPVVDFNSDFETL